METLIVGMGLGVFGTLIVAVPLFKAEKESTEFWKKSYRNELKESHEWEQCARGLNAHCEQLKRQLNQSPQNGIAFKSETAKELVKFAMTQAHPDKPNGSNERFVKYREIYEKVCK